MRTIIKIEYIEPFTSKAGRQLYRTHALIDDGTLCVGFGKDFNVNDKVEVFLDSTWNTIKMRKPVDNFKGISSNDY